MHQTTVRFGADLWQALELECARLGVSVAQYLREAALTRMVYAAGRRGDDEFELALNLVTDPVDQRELQGLELLASPRLKSESARERARRELSEAAALGAQNELLMERARKLRERAAQSRAD